MENNIVFDIENFTSSSVTKKILDLLTAYKTGVEERLINTSPYSGDNKIDLSFEVGYCRGALDAIQTIIPLLTKPDELFEEEKNV